MRPKRGQRTYFSAAVLCLLLALPAAAARHPGPWRKIKDDAEQKKLRAELKGRICFASNRDGNFEIYVMNADGSKQTNLTKNPAWDMFPRWSPDGSKIVFYSDRESDRKLKDHLGVDLTPGWEPWHAPHRDHSSWGTYRKLGVFVMNADGSGIKKLVDGGISPCLSPDGKLLAYEHADTVMILDTATGKKHGAIPRAWGGAWLPTFSPDGKKILCATASRWRTRNERVGFSVTAFDLDDGHRPTGGYRVYAHGGDGCHPEWSADGSKIVFSQDTRGSTIGYIEPAKAEKGKSMKPNVIDIGLDPDKHIMACPDWSPDGKHVVFSLGPVYFEVKPKVVRFGHKKPWTQRGQRIYQEICVTRRQGKVWVQLTDGGHANRDPDWK
jgi:Tol biopolymer transport system component